MEWFDERITYSNLKKAQSLNVLSSDEIESIWTPKLSFTNALGKVFTDLSEGVKIECIPEGEPYSRPNTFVDQSKSIA